MGTANKASCCDAEQKWLSFLMRVECMVNNINNELNKMARDFGFARSRPTPIIRRFHRCGTDESAIVESTVTSKWQLPTSNSSSSLDLSEDPESPAGSIQSCTTIEHRPRSTKHIAFPPQRYLQDEGRKIERQRPVSMFDMRCVHASEGTGEDVYAPLRRADARRSLSESCGEGQKTYRDNESLAVTYERSGKGGSWSEACERPAKKPLKVGALPSRH